MDTDTDSIQESGPGLMGDSIMEEEEEEEASQEQLTPSSQASLRRGDRVTSSTKEATSSSITKEVAKEARVTPTLHQIPLVPDGPVGFASLPDQVYRRSLRKGEVGVGAGGGSNKGLSFQFIYWLINLPGIISNYHCLNCPLSRC